jgi:hypothetical protein
MSMSRPAAAQALGAFRLVFGGGGAAVRAARSHEVGLVGAALAFGALIAGPVGRRLASSLPEKIPAPESAASNV